MDLYRDARRYPFTLRGSGTVVSSADLPMTRAAARWREGRGGITRLYRDCYILGPQLPDLLDRCRASLAVAAPNALVGFHTAAALHGFGVVESPNVHLVLPPESVLPQRDGLVAHRSVVALRCVLVRGIACTAPARTAIDLARVLPRAQALSVLDAALFSRRCTAAQLAAELTLHKGLKGYRKAAELVPLADGRAQCAQETQLRLIVHDAGLTTFEPQVQILDRYGVLRYVVDLADRALRVGAEYDGSSHLDRGRMRQDRTRHNYLSTRHWRMRYFTDDDLYRHPETIPRILRAALADARADPNVTQLPR